MSESGGDVGGAAGGPAVASRPEEAASVELLIGDMDCPSCVAKLERGLMGVDGVRGVQGSPVSRRLEVTFDRTRVAPERLREEVARLGYTAREANGRRVEPAGTWTTPKAFRAYAAGVFFLGGLALEAVGVVGPTRWLFLAAAAVGGFNFFPQGLRAARTLSLDMNFLMSIAIVGAVAIGEYLEAGAIAFLFSLAELLETFSVDRVRASVASLLALAPEVARVERDGREVEIAVDELVVGDVVVVRPGERIPADARVIEGRSAVDQATLTGESVPVDKAPGDGLFAGTLNFEGFLRARVERAPDDSTLARVVRLVEEAETRKTRRERFVERFARRYTPAVTVAAVLIAFAPPLLVGAPLDTWFVRGLTLLVIACPCALVISTPVAVVSGVTAAARHGVLIKGGLHLEALAGVRVVAFDKTGTLTRGRPEVVDVRAVDGSEPGRVLALAAAVERRSEHPIARAIVRRADAVGGTVPDTGAGEVTGFEALTGLGARARVEGHEVVVGRPDLLGVTAVPPADLAVDGRSVVGVSVDGRLAGWIALADRPREHAAEVVAAIRRETGARVVMLTGDHPATAAAMGRELGVDEVRAGLMPADKLAVVRELEAEYGAVVMIGEGVNDAPALAAATVGVAMGVAGSDTALETADVALMGDDLGRVPYLLRLARTADRVIRQNVFVSIGVKALLVAAVPLGAVSLVVAVLVGDMGLSLAVTTNALRLARVRD